MKIAVLIARILLGLMFLVFGLNIYFNFIPSPPMSGDVGTLSGLMFKHGWFTFYGIEDPATGEVDSDLRHLAA